jgi:hypothetical protein
MRKAGRKWKTEKETGTRWEECAGQGDEMFFLSETDLQVVQQDLAYDPLYRIRQERVLDDDDPSRA